MDPFIGEIRAFALQYAPRGWAECNGDILNVSGNEPLFAVIGKTYGGNGTTNFALPNLKGRALIGAGHVAGRPDGDPGDETGRSFEPLTAGQLPAHRHHVDAYAVPADSKLSDVPSGTAFLGRYEVLGSSSVAEHFLAASVKTDTTLSPDTIAAVGGGGLHDNMQPFLTLRYCIALIGIYPVKQ